MNPIDIQKEKVGDTDVFRISGKLDSAAASHLEKALNTSDSKKIVLDLQGLEYINSEGMRALLKIQENHEISLTSLNKKIMEVFAIAGLDRLFNLKTDQP